MCTLLRPELPLGAGRPRTTHSAGAARLSDRRLDPTRRYVACRHYRHLYRRHEHWVVRAAASEGSRGECSAEPEATNRSDVGRRRRTSDIRRRPAKRKRCVDADARGAVTTVAQRELRVYRRLRRNSRRAPLPRANQTLFARTTGHSHARATSRPLARYLGGGSGGEGGGDSASLVSCAAPVFYLALLSMIALKRSMTAWCFCLDLMSQSLSSCVDSISQNFFSRSANLSSRWSFSAAQTGEPGGRVGVGRGEWAEVSGGGRTAAAAARLGRPREARAGGGSVHPPARCQSRSISMSPTRSSTRPAILAVAAISARTSSSSILTSSTMLTTSRTRLLWPSLDTAADGAARGGSTGVRGYGSTGVREHGGTGVRGLRGYGGTGGGGPRRRGRRGAGACVPPRLAAPPPHPSPRRASPRHRRRATPPCTLPH